MSEEQNSGNLGPMVLVEQKSSRQQNPYRPTELQDDTESHRRPPAPPAPSEEQFNDDSGELSTDENTESEEYKRDAIILAMSSEKHKQSSVKNISSSGKKRDHSPESIPLSSMEIDKKRGVIIPPSIPIPPDIESVKSTESDTNKEKEKAKKGDNDSISEETAEPRVADADKQQSEWSDNEEASGLPRSDSRASRVSRAMRQLFCCGVAYEAPSEENIPTRRRHYSEAI